MGGSVVGLAVTVSTRWFRKVFEVEPPYESPGPTAAAAAARRPVGETALVPTVAVALLKGEAHLEQADKKKREERRERRGGGRVI